MFYYLIIYIIAGLLVGSFLNVVIFRLKEAQSLVFGGSKCRKCHTKIKPYDLIPVISFLILGGRCRACREKISFQYPIIEGLTAILFGLSFWVYGLSWMSVLAAVILSLLLVIVSFDFKELMVPEVVSWILLAVALLGSLAINYNHFGSIILGGLVSGGVIALLVFISKGKWMGDGDIKIALAIGLFLTFPVAIFSVFASFITGAVLGSILIILKRKTGKDQLPFTPFLMLGLIISMLWGQRIIDWYLGRFIM